MAVPNFREADAGIFGLRKRKGSDAWTNESSMVVQAFDGLFVPREHLELYTQIVQKHGNLYPASLEKFFPPVIHSAVTRTLDLLHSLRGMKESELTRPVLNTLMGKFLHSHNNGLGVQWMISRLQKLDEVIDMWDLKREQLGKAKEVLGELEQREKDIAEDFKEDVERLKLARTEMEEAAKQLAFTEANLTFTRDSISANRKLLQGLLNQQPTDGELLIL